MNYNQNLLALIFVLIFVGSCKQSGTELNQVDKQESITKKIKSYGLAFEEQDSLSVQLYLKDFQSYKELYDRVKQIECSERIVKLSLEDSTITKNVYFVNDCKESPFKVKNIVRIQEDKIIHGSTQQHYPLDSLESYTKKTITNNGKIDALSSSPEKLHFLISYNDESDPKRLSKTLNKLVESFDQVGGNNILKVVFTGLAKEITPPPPPPIAVPQLIEIEVLEDEEEDEIIETVLSSTSTDDDDDIVEVVEVDEETGDFENSDNRAVSTFNSLTNYMEIQGTTTSSFYLSETNSGRYKIQATAKIDDYIENGINHGTATIKATVPLEKVDDLYISGNIIYLESDNDNYYIVAGFAGKEESHYTYEFEITVRNKSKRDQIYQSLKTLIN